LKANAYEWVCLEPAAATKTRGHEEEKPSCSIVEHAQGRKANGPKGWKSCNLRTSFEKLVNRAGLEPWPRLFHNLRSS
jgi:hypothetical protein